MKYFFFLIILFLFTGCSTKIIYVPTKCKIDIPKRPIFKSAHSDSYLSDIKQNMILEGIYTKELEKALNFCVRGL